MNLSTLSDIDPETGYTLDLGAAGIGFEPQHIPIEFLRRFELRRLQVDPHGMVVDFEYADAHRRSPTSRKWLNNVSRFQACPGNLTIQVGSRVGRRFGGCLILAQRELADSRLVGVKLTLPDNQRISAVDPLRTSTDCTLCRRDRLFEASGPGALPSVGRLPNYEGFEVFLGDEIPTRHDVRNFLPLAFSSKVGR